MTVLHVFDMDGTLLYGTTASLELARAAGLRDEVQALEAEFALGAMSTHSFAVRAAQLWSRPRPDLVVEVSPERRGCPVSRRRWPTSATAVSSRSSSRCRRASSPTISPAWARPGPLGGLR